MASVYKSISKKKQERPVSDELDDEEDIAMNDLIDDETSDSDDDDEDNQGNTASQLKSIKDGFMPKTRVLMLTSRGVTHRYALFLDTLYAIFFAMFFFSFFFFF
jgi:ribosome biogenesis protein BRX1